MLSFDKLILGCRCYLAVSHGFKTEVVMNSRSMFKCVTEQFKLKKGDVLQINGMPNAFTKKKYAKLKFNDLYLKTREIEAYAGAEFHLLSKYQQEKLITTLFSVSKDSNRMAYQLLEPLENSLQAIITSPVIPGTVQLTPSGRLIILMRDCQTTGGYPRVLQLKEQSINTLAQKPINARIKFSLVIPITG